MSKFFIFIQGLDFLFWGFIGYQVFSGVFDVSTATVLITYSLLKTMSMAREAREQGKR